MNGRPRWPWLGFAAGLLLVAAALSYVSVQALRLERLERQTRTAAAVEEAARSALWRMDSALAPIIAREAARPYFHYQPFYPAHRAYTSMWEEVRPGEVLVASPLLSVDDPLIRLYFQGTAAGDLASPQVPTGNMRDLAESAYATSDSVIESERRLTELRAVLAADGHALASVPPPEADQPSTSFSAGGPAPRQQQQQQQQAAGTLAEQARSDYDARQTLNLQARAPSKQTWTPEPQRAQTAAEPAAQLSEAITPDNLRRLGGAPSRQLADLDAASPRPASVVQGDMVAVWSVPRPGKSGGASGAGDATGARLLLVRRVRAADAELIQGVWLEWEALRSWLLAQASDVLPGAGLTPVLDDTLAAAVQSPGRRLAAIPAVLDLPPISAAAGPAWSPMRTTLALSWLAVIAAAVAAGLVLRAAAELAERRGRFVSAVTHELRTPLTTFCLYTQMLDDGMISGESARREYVGTLRRESQRLARIVENVLEFARLGRRTTESRVTLTPVPDLLDRTLPLLTKRAADAGLALEVHAPADTVAPLRTPADPHAVEQILLNLVENACKYAADGAQIDLAVHSNGETLVLTVTDHGRGIDAADQRRLFRPFQRGAALAHGSIPGLGLGLAVSRGLARQSAGDLTLTRSNPDGTTFTLELPLAPTPT